MIAAGFRAAVAAVAFVAAAGAWATTFQHKDWELACDNTGTCRAAGYSSEQDELRMSVLLTRPAGPAQAVQAQVTLGDIDRPSALPARVQFVVAGRSEGRIDLAKPMSPRQVAALMAGLANSAPLEFRAGPETWKLSDAGSTAVLLKMDEVQGRLGTVGALVRKGTAGEQGVRPSQPMPLVRPVAEQPLLPGDRALAERLVKSLAVSGERCMSLAEATANEPVQAWRLGRELLLVSRLCWLAAYNFGHAYWVVRTAPPHQAQLVTTDGSGFSGGTISASHKGRGIGDCHSQEEWVWDGVRFVHAKASTSGMCRLITLGGAWELPTIVSDIRPPAAKESEEKRK